jgi:hypothetical protein
MVSLARDAAWVAAARTGYSEANILDTLACLEARLGNRGMASELFALGSAISPDCMSGSTAAIEALRQGTLAPPAALRDRYPVLVEQGMAANLDGFTAPPLSRGKRLPFHTNESLNEYAWRIYERGDASAAELKSALQAALAATASSVFTEAMVLDTLACVAWRAGDKELALDALRRGQELDKSMMTESAALIEK